MEAILPGSSRLLQQTSKKLAMEPPPNSTFLPPPASSPRPSSPGPPTPTDHTPRQPSPTHHPNLSAQTSNPTRPSPTFQEVAQRRRGDENPYTIDPSASWPLGPEAKQVQEPEEYLVPIPSPKQPDHAHHSDHAHQQPDHSPHKRATYSHAPKPVPRNLDRTNTMPQVIQQPEGGAKGSGSGTDDLPEGAYIELGPDTSSQPSKPTKPKPAPRRKLPPAPYVLSPTQKDNVSDAFYLPMQPSNKQGVETMEEKGLSDHVYEIPDTSSQHNGSRELFGVVDKMTQAFSPAQLDLFVQMLQQVNVGGQTVSSGGVASAASESSLRGNLRKGA